MIALTNSTTLKMDDVEINTHAYVSGFNFMIENKAMSILLQRGRLEGDSFIPDTHSDRRTRISKIFLEDKVEGNGDEMLYINDFTDMLVFIDPRKGFNILELEQKLIDLGHVKGTLVK